MTAKKLTEYGHVILGDTEPDFHKREAQLQLKLFKYGKGEYYLIPASVTNAADAVIEAAEFIVETYNLCTTLKQAFDKYREASAETHESKAEQQKPMMPTRVTKYAINEIRKVADLLERYGKHGEAEGMRTAAKLIEEAIDIHNKQG